jgi:hypothetical protein
MYYSSYILLYNLTRNLRAILEAEAERIEYLEAHARLLFGSNTVKNAVELFFAFHPDVEKIQYH